MSMRLDYLFGEDGKPVVSNYANIGFQDYSCRILDELIQKFEIVSMDVTSPGVFKYVTLKFKDVNYKVDDYIELMGEISIFVPIVMLNHLIRDHLKAIDVERKFVLELNCSIFFEEIPIEEAFYWEDFISKKVKETFEEQNRNAEIRNFLNERTCLLQEIQDLYVAATIFAEKIDTAENEEDIRVLTTVMNSVLGSIDAKQTELAIRESEIMDFYPNIWV